MRLCRATSRARGGAIAKANGIPKLVGVLTGLAGSQTSMKEAAAVQLCTLVALAIKEMANSNRSNQDAITKEGGIQPLVAMLTSPAPEMQANAAGALANLAHHHPDNQGAIARAGVVVAISTMTSEKRSTPEDVVSSTCSTRTPRQLTSCRLPRHTQAHAPRA